MAGATGMWLDRQLQRAAPLGAKPRVPFRGWLLPWWLRELWAARGEAHTGGRTGTRIRIGSVPYRYHEGIVDVRSHAANSERMSSESPGGIHARVHPPQKRNMLLQMCYVVMPGHARPGPCRTEPTSGATSMLLCSLWCRQ